MACFSAVLLPNAMRYYSHSIIAERRGHCIIGPGSRPAEALDGTAQRRTRFDRGRSPVYHRCAPSAMSPASCRRAWMGSAAQGSPRGSRRCSFCTVCVVSASSRSSQSMLRRSLHYGSAAAVRQPCKGPNGASAPAAAPPGHPYVTIKRRVAGASNSGSGNSPVQCAQRPDDPGGIPSQKTVHTDTPRRHRYQRMFQGRQGEVTARGAYSRHLCHGTTGGECDPARAALLHRGQTAEPSQRDAAIAGRGLAAPPSPPV